MRPSALPEIPKALLGTWPEAICELAKGFEGFPNLGLCCFEMASRWSRGQSAGGWGLGFRFGLGFSWQPTSGFLYQEGCYFALKFVDRVFHVPPAGSLCLQFLSLSARFLRFAYLWIQDSSMAGFPFPVAFRIFSRYCFCFVTKSFQGC